MSCILRNEHNAYCTEPKDIRRRLTKILCGETEETARELRTPTRQSTAEQIDNNFDRLFANRGDSTNLGQCTVIRNPRCSSCRCDKKKPKRLFKKK